MCIRGIKSALLLLVSLGVNSGQAQLNSGVSRSAWYIYNGEHAINDRWGLRLEGQVRRSPILANPQQLLFRSGVVREVGKGFKTTLGYTFVLSSPPVRSTDVLGVEPSHSVFEQVSRNDGALGVKIQQMLRFEHTFVGKRRDQTSLTWVYRQRVRYRLGVELPLRLTGHSSYVALYNEPALSIFPQGRRSVFHLDRTYVATGWHLRQTSSLEIGYMHQYRPLSNGIVAEQNDSLQLTLNASGKLRDLLQGRW